LTDRGTLKGLHARADADHGSGRFDGKPLTGSLNPGSKRGNVAGQVLSMNMGFPFMSQGGLEPLAYITAAGTDPWLSI